MGACGQLERIKLGHRSVRYTPESLEALLCPYNDVETAGNGLHEQEVRGADAINPTG